MSFEWSVSAEAAPAIATGGAKLLQRSTGASSQRHEEGRDRDAKCRRVEIEHQRLGWGGAGWGDGRVGGIKCKVKSAT